MCSCSAGMCTTWSATCANGDDALRGQNHHLGAEVLGASGDVLGVAGSAGATDGHEQIAPTGGGGNGLAGDERGQAGMHEPHAEAPRDQAASPGAGDESVPGSAKAVGQHQKAQPVGLLHRVGDPGEQVLAGPADRVSIR